MFFPVASTRFEGHYCTFMEMCDKNPEEMPIGDTGMPSLSCSTDSLPLLALVVSSELKGVASEPKHILFIACVLLVMIEKWEMERK